MAKAIDFLVASENLIKGSDFNVTVTKGKINPKKYYVMSFDYYKYSGGSSGLEPDAEIITQVGCKAYLYSVDNYKSK